MHRDDSALTKRGFTVNRSASGRHCDSAITSITLPSVPTPARFHRRSLVLFYSMTSPSRFFLLLLTALFSAVIAPADASDQTVERAALWSYNFTTLLENRVQVSVKNGVVTLTGTAHDRDLRSLASDTVLGIPEVTAVNNQIVVETSVPEYSDTWVALKLRNCLLARGGFDARLIEIAVKNQVATLTGTVESAEQRELVEKHAGELPWVRAVKNELVVAAALPASTTAQPAVDDASLAALLRYTLAHERLITSSRIKVAALHGAVHITGHADSEAEQALILAHVRSIRGVVSVQNEMVVRR